MSRDYSVQEIEKLAERYRAAGTHRPMRVERYDPGAELTYDVTGVVPARRGRVTLTIDRFVGGGFAGQVYRVRVKRIEAPDGPLAGLEEGGLYAMKILVPPSRGSLAFRDLIYRIGFQAPFQLQVNPDAARAGALWQKFIRRAAAHRFGDERTVVDVLATFVDSAIGSCGELSEWVEGRTWRYEVDDRLQDRKRRFREGDLEGESSEYLAKKTFMRDFVRLLHDLGAHEFARQYEWWTCKSQPNALKRLDTNDDPRRGLTAVDFRAGLALLPVLPMSPGDVPLIVKGLFRGSLVQFDRGDLDRLAGYVRTHREQFTDMREALEELMAADDAYRDAQIDVTHHNVQLLYDVRLWGNILNAAVTGWRTANKIDERTEASLRQSKLKTLTMGVLGALATLTGPVGWAGAIVKFIAGASRYLGAYSEYLDAKAIAKDQSAVVFTSPDISWTWLWIFLAVGIVGPPLFRTLFRLLGREDFRKHVRGLLSSWDYLRRAADAHVLESVIHWHRNGRMDAAWARLIARHTSLYMLHAPLSLLPASLHRVFTSRREAMDVVRSIFVRPVKLYFNPEVREEWLRDMVAEGRRRHMLTEDDAETILSRIKEPFIQKYLKALAVHVCTLPITQVVSVIVAIWYKVAHGLTWGQAWDEMLAIIFLFQLTPVSPGSLVRGLYVLYLVIRERNYKDYNIAVFLGFFKYVGYLAFPIQMAYRYPVLARFMAAHWATGAVHIVPVFGEHGALLEHKVFDLFYNYPLSVRRRMAAWAEYRQGRTARYWHAPVLVTTSLAVLVGADLMLRDTFGTLPSLSDAWPLTVFLPLNLGLLVTRLAGGASMGKRLKLSMLCGVVTAVLYAIIHLAMMFVPALGGQPAPLGDVLEQVAKVGLWAAFLYTLLAAVASLVTEIAHGEPPKES